MSMSPTSDLRVGFLGIGKLGGPVLRAIVGAGWPVTAFDPRPEALAPFGLDPRQKAFWAAGMKQLERLVDEFEALATLN